MNNFKLTFPSWLAPKRTAPIQNRHPSFSSAGVVAYVERNSFPLGKTLNDADRRYICEAIAALARDNPSLVTFWDLTEKLKESESAKVREFGYAIHSFQCHLVLPEAAPSPDLP